MKKKLFSLILILCMVMSLCAGCGDKDDDDEDSDGKGSGPSSKKPTTVQEVVTQMQGVKSGSFRFGMDATVPETTMNCSINSKISGENCSLGMKITAEVEGKSVAIDIEEVLVVVDKILYVNLQGLLDAVLDNAELTSEINDNAQVVFEKLKDVKLGWFAIPLPDDYKVENMQPENIQKIAEKLINDLLSKGTADGMKVTFDKIEQIQAMMEVIAVFIETDMSKVFDESLKFDFDVDLNKYAEKLIDYYYDDAVATLEELNAGISKEQIDEMIKQVKEQDLNQLLEQLKENSDVTAEVPDAAELASMASEVRNVAKRLDGKEMPGQLVVEASAKGDVYRTDVKLDVTEEGESGNITIYYEIDSSKPSISAPSKVLSLKDIADEVMNVLMSMAGAN